MNLPDPKKKDLPSKGESYDKDGRIVNSQDPKDAEDVSIRHDETPLPSKGRDQNNKRDLNQHEEFIDMKDDQEVEE